MLSRLRESLLQGNRVLPVVLAVLAVLILVWIIFGLVLGGDDQGQVADQEIVAQSQEGDADGAEPATPEVENRNVDSYAAYEAKDPFRQLVEFADADTAGTTPEETVEQETVEQETGSNEAITPGGATNEAGGRQQGGGQGGGGQRGQGMDSDDDKVSDNREEQLDLDPTNPDTDGDGIRDGADDSNRDGRPDRDIGRRGAGSGGRNGDSGGNDGLFDSGGSIFRSGE